MRSPLLVLLLTVAGATPQQHASEPETAAEPVSATPLRIPADFCFGAADEEKRCTATVSFDVLASGAVGHVAIVRSSGDRVCDSAAMESVRSRRYPPDKPFAVAQETLRTPRCKANVERAKTGLP